MNNFTPLYDFRLSHVNPIQIQILINLLCISWLIDWHLKFSKGHFVAQMCTTLYLLFVWSKLSAYLPPKILHRMIQRSLVLFLLKLLSLSSIDFLAHALHIASIILRVKLFRQELNPFVFDLFVYLTWLRLLSKRDFFVGRVVKLF